MKSVVFFLLGMAGALAPEIVRLYGIRNAPERFAWSWFYVVVSAAFAALGGLLALAMPATTYWGAVYIGISTPVLVNSVIRKGRDLSRQEMRSRPVRVGLEKEATRYSLVDSYLRGL